jgi:hypothetical protein
MADGITRTGFQNQLNQIVEASDALSADEKARQKKAVKLFGDFAEGSSDIGTLIGGFQTLAQEAKAAEAKKKGKPNPIPAKATSTLGETPNTKTPSSVNKTAIDALTGKTSAENNIIHPAITGANPKAIRATLLEAYALNRDEIDANVKLAAEKAAADPNFQEAARKFGFDADGVTDLVKTLPEQADKLLDPSNDPVDEIVVEQKLTSKIQMEQLDNPLGSFKMKIPVDDFPIDTPTAPDAGLIQQKLKQESGISLDQVVERLPFGNMGVDFGNILGNVGSKSLGGATSKELGQVIPEIGQASDVEIPTNIINEKGFTDLFSSVQKGSLKIDAEPTTPIEKIGITSGQIGDFIYTRVTSAQELELELKTIQRKITNVNMGWTGSAADVKFTNAKAYNDGIIKAKQIQYQIMNLGTNNIPERERAAWMHYFINKNGTIERVMPLETFPNTKSYAADRDAIGGLVNAFADIGFKPAEIDLEFADQQLKDGISIIIDAGHSVATDEKTQQTYSKKSITDESWRSIDKVLSTIVKVFPYVEAYTHDDLLNDLALGPGFEVSDYLKRYSEDEDG